MELNQDGAFVLRISFSALFFFFFFEDKIKPRAAMHLLAFDPCPQVKSNPVAIWVTGTDPFYFATDSKVPLQCS